MSDELVERLLDWPYQGETMAHEAAARIEQLAATNEQLTAERDKVEAENERLRAALFAWIDMMNDPSTKLRRKVIEFYSIAIAALK